MMPDNIYALLEENKSLKSQVRELEKTIKSMSLIAQKRANKEREKGSLADYRSSIIYFTKKVVEKILDRVETAISMKDDKSLTYDEIFYEIRSAANLSKKAIKMLDKDENPPDVMTIID